jgi:hypothetical protein
MQCLGADHLLPLICLGLLLTSKTLCPGPFFNKYLHGIVDTRALMMDSDTVRFSESPTNPRVKQKQSPLLPS